MCLALPATTAGIDAAPDDLRVERDRRFVIGVIDLLNPGVEGPARAASVLDAERG